MVTAGRGEQLFAGYEGDVLITPDELAELNRKLDEVLAFQRQLLPFLPLLERVNDLLSNPATKFRDITRMRKAAKNDRKD